MLAIITLISLVPTLLIWLPFFLRLEQLWTIPLPPDGMATIVANYDGPLFIVVAKTMYNIEAIGQNYSFPLPAEYYAAHFPFFPVLIKASAYLLGFPYALLVTTLTTSALAIYYFYKLISKYVDKKNLLFVTLAFAIFPARWLIVRSVGSSEPLFIAATIASIYYFQKEKYWYAGLAGAVAMLTRSAGILLFIAYVGAILFPSLKNLVTNGVPKWLAELKLNKIYPILLIPLSLIGLFGYYKIQFGNFLAYFSSGDNIHLFFPPFQIFNYSASWVGTFWLEEVILIYLILLIGLFRLIKQKRNLLAWYVGVFVLSLFFVSHRDAMRYALPLVPLMYVAFSDVVVKREFKFILAILAIPIYLFSISFISQNVMPISDWAPFL